MNSATKSSPWTARDDEILLRMRAEGYSRRQIGDALGRTMVAIKNRILKINAGPVTYLPDGRVAKAMKPRRERVSNIGLKPTGDVRRFLETCDFRPYNMSIPPDYGNTIRSLASAPENRSLIGNSGQMMASLGERRVA